MVYKYVWKVKFFSLSFYIEIIWINTLKLIGWNKLYEISYI